MRSRGPGRWGRGVPSAKLRIADEFVEALAGIGSDRVLARIRAALNGLGAFPEMGSPLVRRSIANLYGEGLRQIPISSFLVVYRYDGEFVDVLTLVYGPSVA